MADATLIAGVPAENPTLYRAVRLAAGDPAAWIAIDGASTLIIRDIEVQRARGAGGADTVACPADFAPRSGLDADRATATAQATAEMLRSAGVGRVRTDRTLPFIFAWHVMQAGIGVDYDPDLGVIDRRTKQPHELEALQRAQQVTEQAMEMACRLIARSDASGDGTLQYEGQPLTSQRVKSLVAGFLLERGFTMGHGAIVAAPPDSGDCHHDGSGPLRTGVPVIVDLFPRDESTRYWGDCTRTVVHGTASDTVLAMHRAVVAAKQAATDQLRVGQTAQAVHAAAVQVLQHHGYPLARGQVTDHPSIQHGTGHGIGLEVHEPILLDDGGGPILANEVFTVEPGLYGRHDGGVRVEDMIVATDDGPRNFNRLPENLDWR